MIKTLMGLITIVFICVADDQQLNKDIESYLHLGDRHMKNFIEHNSTEAREEALQAYRHYVSLLRQNSRIPKIPYRVAKLVYLENETYHQSYPDAWGYSFLNDATKDDLDVNLHFHLLKNGDYSIWRRSGARHSTPRRILFFAQVEITDQDVEGKYRKKLSAEELVRKVLPDETTQISETANLSFKPGKFVYRNNYGVTAMWFNGLEEMKISYENNSTKRALVAGVFPESFRQELKPKYLKDVDSEQTVTSKCFTLPSDEIQLLNDGTFLYVNEYVIIRFDSQLNTKASFINNDVFVLNGTEIDKISSSVSRTGHWTYQEVVDAFCKYINDKHVNKATEIE